MPSETRRLSVAMIARDAQPTIAASLDSIRHIADEIIVADTGSLDRTRQIALARATKVVDVPWTDDFSAARNACLASCTGEWVLWLDAGERIAAETAEQIRAFIDAGADPAKAYLLLVQLPPSGEHGMSEQVGRIRLMPNRPTLRFTGRIRESLHSALAALGMRIELKPWQIQRDAEDQDPTIKARKARRDWKLAELELRDRGETAIPLVAMGEALTNLGDSRQAADCFRRALAVARPASTEMLEAYFGLLTTYDRTPESHNQQVKICVQALETFPFDAQLLCAIGSYMQRAGRLDLASRSYRTAVRHGQINLETWHVAAIRDVATLCLSLSLELLGEDDEAREVVEQSLAGQPDPIRLRRRLIDLYVKHDRRKEALEQVSLLPPETPHRDALRSAVRGACLAAQKNWVAARAYLQTAYDSGCRDLLCLRWLSLALASTGDLAAAEPILRQWQDAAPGIAEPRRYLDMIAAGQSPTGESAAPTNGQFTEGAGRRLRIDPPAAISPSNLPPGLGQPIVHQRDDAGRQ
jgi:tetratricopeptide (TPR) repeat protein